MFSITGIDLNRDFIVNNGARYYIGYYESDLSINNEAIDTRKGCGSCGGSVLKKYAPYVDIKPFAVDANHTYLNKDLFDTDAVGYTDQTFGLSGSINVTCDVSALFCDNKQLFATALQKKVVINCFWDVYNSKELGYQTELSKEDARLMAEKYQLELDDELKKIVLDFEGILCGCIGSRRGSLSILEM